MPLPLLFEGRFDAWCEAARRDAGLWLFVHVPKTAGSSLSRELALLAPPYHNIHVDHADRARPAQERYDAAVEAFLAAAAARPFRSASGHVQNRHVEWIRAALPGVRCVSLLRHPLARLVSDYRYQRSAMHPRSAEVIRDVPDFEAFIDLPGQRNRAARHLLPAPIVRQERVEQGIAYLTERYAFIGLQEHYALSFAALTALIAAPRAPGAALRVNAETAQVPLTPALIRRVEQRNALDYALYTHVAERFAAIEAALGAWLEARRASVAESVPA